MRDSLPDPGFACPRCESQSYTILFQDTDRLYRTTEKVFSVIECSGCALIRLFPRPAPDELASFYPEEYWWKADETFLGRLTEIYRLFVLRDHVRFIAASPIPSGPILDVGSGSGALVEALRRHGLPAAGLDPSPRAARLTGSGGAPAVCAALPDTPFDPGSLAAVTVFHVLEHVADPSEFLLAVRRLLQPGGRLFVQVPNAASWQFILLGRRWSALDVPRHLVHFRADDLEDLLGGLRLSGRAPQVFFPSRQPRFVGNKPLPRVGTRRAPRPEGAGTRPGWRRQELPLFGIGSPLAASRAVGSGRYGRIDGADRGCVG